MWGICTFSTNRGMSACCSQSKRKVSLTWQGSGWVALPCREPWSMLGSTSLWMSTQRNMSAPATRFASLPFGFLIGQSNYSSLLLMKREIKCFPQLTHTVLTGHIKFSWKTYSPKIILMGPSYRMRSCQHCIVPSAGPTHRTCCLRTDGPLCLCLCFLMEQVECQMWRWASGHAGIPTDTWTQLI